MLRADTLRELVVRILKAGLVCESVKEPAGNGDCVCRKCELVRDARYALKEARP